MNDGNDKINNTEYSTQTDRSQTTIAAVFANSHLNHCIFCMETCHKLA